MSGMSTDGQTVCGEAKTLLQFVFSGVSAASAHRYHLLLLALMGQVLDAIDEKLVGADVGPASFDHPAAQLHQLEEGGQKKGERHT